MDRPTARPAENQTLGIAMVVLATIVFACSDVVSKALLETMSPVQASWIRSVVVLAVTLGFAWFRLRQRMLRTARPGMQVFRGTAVVLSSLSFLIGLAHLTVVDTVALNFITPILVMALAVPMLGERIGVARWVAAFVAFLGVLVIVRPGSAAFQAASLFPVLGAVLWALSSVVTRRMMGTESPEATLAWSAIVAFLVLSVIAPFVWRPPTLREFGLAVIVGLGSSLAHGLFVFAMERARASVVAPFTYGQLIWSTALAWLAFGTIPDAWTVSGAILIVASGLFAVTRRT